MKKLISLLFAIVTVIAAWAQSGQGYDPTNPPDPESGFRLTVNASPAKGGDVNRTRPAFVPAGQDVYLEAWPKAGYEFRAWMNGDRVVSENSSFYFTMPEENTVLTAWFDWTGYNPANPGDPADDGYNHYLRAYNVPSSGGWVSNGNCFLKEGERMTLYAYPNDNFKFSCWKQDGKIISTDQYLEVTMGKSNLEYVAQYVYNPMNPGDPGANSFNRATGELIIDSFSQGDLWWTVDHIMNGEGYEDVSSITVIGKVSRWDFGVCRQFPNLQTADFGRTSGAETFDWTSFHELYGLTKIVLPASITYFDGESFMGLQSLSELVMYAPMPPGIGCVEDYFRECPESLVVKVYSSSLDLYMDAPVWQNYKIMTIDEESTALTVTLPADAADGRYANCSLMLSNFATGQSQKLVVTGTRSKFIFGNLVPDMKYGLYVMAPNGNVLGDYTDFVIPAEGLDYQFDSLKQVKEVTFALLSPQGEDLADMASISWFDSFHKFIATGRSLTGQVEGDQISYEISLPRELALQYVLPESGVYTVAEGDNCVKVSLKALARTKTSGYVLDSTSGDMVAGAYVTLTQTVNGHAVSATVSTDALGEFSLEAYELPMTLTVGSPDHNETVAEFKSPAALADDPKLQLKPLKGIGLNLMLLARENILRDATDNAFVEYEDYANVDFAVFNRTTGQKLTDLRLKYPVLLVLGDVKEGDMLDVTATPLAGKYNAEKVTVKVGAANTDVKFAFTADGDLTASYKESDAEEILASLYDAKGVLYKTASFADGKVSFEGLPDGDYSLVAMMTSRLFSGAGSLAELSQTGLVAGNDYLMEKVAVAAGYITPVEFGIVPLFDETLFSYTTPETSVSVNKSSVTVGQTVTVRSKVEFLEKYAPGVEKVKITFTFPEGCDYVENSLLIAGNGSNFTEVDGRRMSVWVQPQDAAPRFCVVPREGGEYRPSASIEFEYEGRTIVQPIGSALFTASDFTISAPEKTCVTAVTARGAAPALSEVKVYDNDVFIGTTRSLTNGDWRLKFDLFQPGDRSEHLIRAEITTEEGHRYSTNTVKTIFDKDWAELASIEMVYGGTVVNFNHIDATTTPNSYSYVPGNSSFSFKANFREECALNVRDLDFIILLSDGTWKRMNSKYIPSNRTFVCATTFPDVNRLPVNVKVLFAERRDTTGLHAADIVFKETDRFRCPDVVPIIDPSGYVYEAVASNRVPGVQSTIYYREYVEDMYGDVAEQVVKWDAEAYAQENPLFTDEDGMYQWDVPAGEWQVVFEKDGYETARTEWLPVPPPQLDVNVAITQLTRPEVKMAHAYRQSVEVEFDKYMAVDELIAAGNVVVNVDGSYVAGEIVLPDCEEGPDGAEYASKLRFEAAEPFAGEVVSLMVSNKVKSYAGIQMESTFMQEFDIEPEIESIAAPEAVSLNVGHTAVIPVEVLPASASAGRILVVEANTPLVTFAGEVTIDEEGKAIVSIDGELPGDMQLYFSVKDAFMEKTVTNVTVDVLPYFEVSVAAGKGGAVDFENGSFEKGTSLVIAATPAEGYHFTQWSDGNTDNPRTLTVESETALVAEFDVNFYKLNIYINDELISSEEVAYGSEVSIETPEAPEGMKFDGWLDELPETMPAHDVDIHGVFAKIEVSAEMTVADDSMVTVYRPDGTIVARDILWKEIRSTLAKGLYIINGRKYMLR